MAAKFVEPVLDAEITSALGIPPRAVPCASDRAVRHGGSRQPPRGNRTVASSDKAESSVEGVEVGQGIAGPGAHSGVVDLMSCLVCLPLTDVEGHPVLRELQQQWLAADST